MIESNSKDSINNVIDGGYCIGCGACAVVDPSNIDIIKNKYGELIALVDKEPNSKVTHVCPFLSNIDESVLGKNLFSQNKNVIYHENIGYYDSLYAGYISDTIKRENSSSGGLTTWLLEALFENNMIDGVIHVGPTNSSSAIFSYSISHSINEINTKKKSRYYPTSFNDVLLNIDKSKRYAFVGVPCYIKAARLLCLQDESLKRSLTYFIGLFCGHLKSAAFSELLAWEQGIKPNNLKYIDFRVKNKQFTANNYEILVESKTEPVVRKQVNKKLYGTDWGLGYFKLKSCDWCDDITGELADITLGDAWLPEYTHDYNGTNIVVVRNPTLSKLLEDGAINRRLILDKLSPEKIYQSQAGNYRHRREGLSFRISVADREGQWHPQKRVIPADYQLSKNREKIYSVRTDLVEYSKHYFLKAKEKNSLFYFKVKMLPHELRYAYCNKILIKVIAKKILTLLKLY